jgi:hypothetical protein
MTDKQIVKQYTAEPTLAQLHMDDSLVRYIGGPFGSGKSSGCVMEIVMRALRQQPDANGVRKSRWAIVRNTYPELKSTTIKTFQEWVPNQIAPVVYGIPITCNFKQKLNDGTRVELEVVFMALDTDEDVKKLLSMELTGAYLNEARELPWSIVEGLLGRIDRFPKTEKNESGAKIYGPTEPGMLMDSNPPKTSHWLYEKFETGKTPVGWKKFVQPPAVYKDQETGHWVLNPDAENLSHLPDNYYQQQMNAATDDFIRVNLGGEFGMSRKGKPVFTKYSEHKHVAKEKLVPIRGYPIIVGMDFGLTPASVLMQVTGRGIRIYDELPASDETLEDYLDEYLQPLLAKKYQGYQVVASGDPAGNQRDRHTKQNDFMILRARGIKAFPAITNDITQRISCVNWFLGRDEGFIIDPACTHLREAMGGGYVLKESKNTQGQYLDVPVKNEYSHIADATEYGALYARFGTRSTTPKIVTDKGKKPYLYA